MTMHDVLDAQWMLDNNRDGERSWLSYHASHASPSPSLLTLPPPPSSLSLPLLRVLHAPCGEAIGSLTHFTQEDSAQRQCSEGGGREGGGRCAIS